MLNQCNNEGFAIRLYIAIPDMCMVRSYLYSWSLKAKTVLPIVDWVTLFEIFENLKSWLSSLLIYWLHTPGRMDDSWMPRSWNRVKLFRFFQQTGIVRVWSESWKYFWEELERAQVRVFWQAVQWCRFDCIDWKNLIAYLHNLISFSSWRNSGTVESSNSYLKQILIVLKSWI